ncbi:thioredoxin [Leptothoe sp. PORK10 BA2]|uniref:thioredoxin n=1 Tax=Leptothoe sp. PORK10 BA2 TaxID=3110254 RepID=UPI002B21220C|nr:thioredoxin [Leptothoe sp. PORK10 BA2]MEA5466521.1 thioredoxin [Leptothoe sp. PORK10 BA2]
MYESTLVRHVQTFGASLSMAAEYLPDEAALDNLITTQPMVVMDCTASWCGPCKLVAPLMDQLADEYGDQVTVVKLDIDNNKSVAKRFGIKSIPAVLFFKQGEQVDTVIGAKPYSEFSSTLAKHL